MRPAYDRSIGSLLGELSDESRLLIRQEIALARAETLEKLGVFRRNLKRIVVGMAFAIGAFLLVLAAANRGLTVVLGEYLQADVVVWLAPLILAAFLGLIGYALIATGSSRIKRESVTPQKTKETLKEDKRWIEARLK